MYSGLYAHILSGLRRCPLEWRLGLIDTGFAMFRPSALSAMQGHGFAPGGLVAALSRSSDRFRWRRWVASFMVLCMLAVSLLMPAVSAEGQTDGGVVVRVVDGTTGLPVDAGVPVMTVVLSDGIEISRWSAVTNGDGELRVPSQSPGQLTLAISATYEGASYARRFDVQDGEPVELTVYQVMPADQLDITERMALILEPGDAPGGINIKQFVRFENAGTRAAVYGAGGLLLPVPAAMSNLSVESDLSPDTPFGLVDELALLMNRAVAWDSSPLPAGRAMWRSKLTCRQGVAQWFSITR